MHAYTYLYLTLGLVVILGLTLVPLGPTQSMNEQSITGKVICTPQCLAYEEVERPALCLEYASYCSLRKGCQGFLFEEHCQEFFRVYYGYNELSAEQACYNLQDRCSTQRRCVTYSC